MVLSRVEHFSQISPGVPEASLRFAVAGNASLYYLRSLKMKTGWGFLAGLGVGTVATLMLAPRSGKDTQELLAGKLRGGLDQVASAGQKVRAQVKDIANRGKENIAGAIDTGTEAYRTSVSGG
jgi:gas vesicle protein